MRILLLLVLAFLAGCATAPAPVAGPAPPPPSGAGMERLMGQAAETATALLGAASLDRREGPARQLQFAGACVLDLFYYPRPGSVPVATHAEARASDGRPMAAGDCLRLLIAGRRS